MIDWIFLFAIGIEQTWIIVLSLVIVVCRLHLMTSCSNWYFKLDHVIIAFPESRPLRISQPSSFYFVVLTGGIWRMPKPSTPTNRKTSASTSTPQNSSSQESLYVVRDVLDQKGDKYLLAWAGIDPQTGKPWEPTWVESSPKGLRLMNRNPNGIVPLHF